MLWLCLQFPHLSVDLAQQGLSQPAPLAVVEERGNRRWLHDVNRLAAESGVRAGQGINPALALEPALKLVPRDPDAEVSTLSRLATWAYGYSSMVSCEDHGILLEISRSQRLSHGVQTLLRTLLRALADMGLRSLPAAAPTPAAARLLAESSHATVVTSPQTLAPWLEKIGLEHSPLPSITVEDLGSAGVHSVAALLRLPRHGLARRYGQACLDWCGRLAGELPESPPLYRPPAGFQARIRLPSPVEAADQAMFVVQRLVHQLCTHLEATQHAVERFELDLGHEYASTTTLVIGLMRPGRDPEHFSRLCREKLDGLELPDGVSAVSIRADRLVALAPSSGDLFGHGPRHPPWHTLAERLSSRFGPNGLRSVQGVSDHRPEYAWKYCAPGTSARPLEAPGARPIWLLPDPRPLDPEGLEFLSGPERIENGWWDGRDVCRDYYVVRNVRGERLWVYRDRREAGRWFVHGLFS